MISEKDATMLEPDIVLGTYKIILFNPHKEPTG